MPRFIIINFVLLLFAFGVVDPLMTPELVKHLASKLLSGDRKDFDIESFDKLNDFYRDFRNVSDIGSTKIVVQKLQEIHGIIKEVRRRFQLFLKFAENYEFELPGSKKDETLRIHQIMNDGGSGECSIFNFLAHNRVCGFDKL